MPRALNEVVFVDGVRTPFGKAGDKGMYAQTRADDLVIRCIRELLHRNPNLPKDKVEEVAIAATTQIGDQGLTLGRTAALLSGLPNTTPGYSDRPDVRRRHDRRHEHRELDRLRCLRHRHRRRRRAHGPPPHGRGRRPQPAHRRREDRRPRRPRHGQDRREPPRPLPAADEAALRRLRRGQPGQARPRRTPTARSSATSSPSRRATPSRAGAWPPPTSRPAPARPSRTSASSRRRSVRTATSPRATRPGSTTAPPPCLLASEAAATELGLPVRMRLVSLLVRRRRARGHGRRSGAGHGEGPRQGGPHHRRHRPLRAQRGVRRPGARLPRPLRHRRRRPARQRVRRRHRHGSPARQLGRAPHDPARAPVRGAPRGPLRPDRDVHRHRHGRRRHLGEPAPRGLRVLDDDAARPTRRSPSERHHDRAAHGRSRFRDRGRHPHSRARRRPPGRRRDPGARHPRQRLATTPSPTPSARSRSPGSRPRSTRLRERAEAGEIVAVAVTGKPFIFAVGADLTGVPFIGSRDQALEIARAGHAAYAAFSDLPVPTFAFVNGAAMGGGVELALSATTAR